MLGEKFVLLLFDLILIKVHTIAIDITVKCVNLVSYSSLIERPDVHISLF